MWLEQSKVVREKGQKCTIEYYVRKRFQFIVCVSIVCHCFQPLQESSHCFWPQGSGSADVDGIEEVYGKLRVTLKRLSNHGDITEMRLDVTGSEGKASASHKIVTLLQLSSWPLHELPHYSAVLALMDLLNKAQRSSPTKHTIVMCRYSIILGMMYSTLPTCTALLLWSGI